MPDTGREKLRNNYKTCYKTFDTQVNSAGKGRLTDIYSSVLSSISVVQIDVSDPTNGPKIFDSLNSKQEPMTIADLVRNEVFSRVANEDVDFIDNIDETYWQPFYKILRNIVQSYLNNSFSLLV